MKKRRSLDYDGLDGVLDVAKTTQATSGWRPSYGLVALVLVGAVGAYISLTPIHQPTETRSAIQTVPAKTQVVETPHQPEAQPSPAIEQPAAITAEPVAEELTPTPTQPSNQPATVTTEQTAMTIYFKLDASKPSFSDKTQLQTLVDAAKNCPNQLQLTGHTCNLGTADLNKALGLNRATNLKKLLVAHGIAENKILIASAGMDKPAASNTTAQGQALNRRVELICITP